MSLFRKEVIERRADRLHGNVSIAVPMSWQAIGYAMVATLIAAFLFLVSMSYARVETVPGAIVLDRGVVPIIPSRPGVLLALHAAEGQAVRAGSPLAQIGTGENLTGGGTPLLRALDSIDRQDAGLSDQSTQFAAAAAAERSRLEAQIAGLEQEIVSLGRQTDVQQELVATAVDEVELVRGVARRGFISRRDVLAREETLLGRRQQLAQLEQLRAAKAAALLDARRMVAQARAEAAAQAAGLESSRAQLAQRRTEALQQASYVLAAPMNGIATAVTARTGQTVNPQQALMTIMPENARPRAELYVPTRASGFLQVGHEVRLAVDAFPYQQFGTIPARIASIASATIPRPAPDGGTVPVYLVIVDLDRPWVAAYGRRQPLLPGMLLTARIVTENRSLIEWLFEPLFAVRNR